MTDKKTTITTKAIDRSDSLQDLATRIGSDFYCVFFELVEFYYKKDVYKDAFCNLTIQDLVDIYAMAGTDVRQPDSRVVANIFEIPAKDANEKILIFCSMKGKHDSVEIAYDPQSAWCKEHFAVLTDKIYTTLGEGDLAYFNVGMVYSVHPLSMDQPIFATFAQWGFCMIIINQTLNKGIIIFGDAIFG